MIDSLGLVGWAGLVLLLAGIGVIAYAEPLVALGLVIVLVGLGLVVKQVLEQVMRMFGMA